MTEHLNEWDELVTDWRELPSPSDADTLRALVARQRRRMVIGVIADVAVSILFVSSAVTLLVRTPGASSVLLAANILVMLVAAWTFSIWSRRGTWRPLGETTAQYLELARARSRRQLQAIRFGALMMVTQLVIVGVWVLWGPGLRGPTRTSGAMTIALPVAVVVAFTGAFSWARARARRELQELDSLANSVGG